MEWLIEARNAHTINLISVYSGGREQLMENPRPSVVLYSLIEIAPQESEKVLDMQDVKDV